MYSIGKLSKLSNVTIRTLRYYDEIGLLPPTSIGEGGRRYYDNDAVLKLHNIIFLKELGFELETIHEILADQIKSAKDLLQIRLEIIQAEEKQLQKSKEKIQAIIQLMELNGDDDWQGIFNTFTDVKSDKQKIIANWNKYFTEEEQEILNQLPRIGEDHEEVEKWTALINDIRLHIHKEPSSSEAQSLAKRWMGLVDNMFKGDQKLSQKVWHLNWEKKENLGVYEYDPEITDFIRRAYEYYFTHGQVGESR
ncbi:MerR family transcriptional regulator [Virgibacillus profundi]|nr:MerR family transcriptional regulator [Virgibacillus profundi]